MLKSNHNFQEKQSMLLFKYMNRFLNFINALQCLVRYHLLNLSRIINLDSRNKVKKLTHYSLWLSPQQLVEMNRKCNNFLILQDTRWQLKDSDFTALAEFPHPSVIPWYGDVTEVSTLSENMIWNWIWVHSFHSSYLSN